MAGYYETFTKFANNFDADSPHLLISWNRSANNGIAKFNFIVTGVSFNSIRSSVSNIFLSFLEPKWQCDNEYTHLYKSTSQHITIKLAFLYIY